ncbi:hypothetical protein B0H63DRAFT_535911 [Podospora didyma]|uniref:Uncharacterized protein n=1 Tax=Podospora didyma TaxID=330526 RepID=A0AAE0K0L4_9PEZI|nr:hypothetical protein B0H63DRAFT_535911 [Podospora didyma]
MLRSESGGVFVQAVHGAVIPLAVPRVLAALSAGTSGGEGDGLVFRNPLSQIADMLMSFSDEAIETLEASVLLAAVPVSSDDPEGRYMHLWTICSLSALAPGNRGSETPFMGRESLDRSFVIARKSTRGLAIIAYLAINNVRSGTFVVPVSKDGHVDILLRTPMRSDILNSEFLPDRKLSAIVRLIDIEVFAAESGNQEGLRAALEAYLASTAEPEVEALVQIIGDHRTIIGSILIEFNDRGLSADKRSGTIVGGQD